MNWWKTFWEKQNNLLGSLETEAKYHVRVFFVFSAVAIPVLSFFALFHLIQGSILEFLQVLPVPLFFGISLFIVLKTKLPRAILLINTILLYAHYARLLYIGGADGSNIFWMLSFPLAAFLILGRRAGTIATLASLVGIGLILFPPGLIDLNPYPYALAVKVRFLISYAVIGLLAFLSENVRFGYQSENERAQRILLEIQEELLTANSEIQKASITDQLTQCYNRHHLVDQFNQEMERAKRYDRPLSVVLCDIDHFKKINDSYGHPVGDRVLATMGGLLREAVRIDIDWVVRYGGEEFLLVLPETNLKGAGVVAERVRAELAETVLDIESHRVRVTASFGVTTMDGKQDKNVDFSAIFSLVDKLLYQAKEQGRNRVVLGAGGSA